MEEWVSTLLSLVASAIISGTIGVIIKRAIERSLDRSISEQKELIALRSEKERRERREDVLTTLRAELLPINEKIDKLSDQVNNGMEGTVTLLRETMKQTRDQFIKQGYVSSSDAASWHELYNTYTKLGGNHFKEYVNSWLHDVEELRARSSSDLEN